MDVLSKFGASDVKSAMDFEGTLEDVVNASDALDVYFGKVRIWSAAVDLQMKSTAVDMRIPPMESKLKIYCASYEAQEFVEGAVNYLLGGPMPGIADEWKSIHVFSKSGFDNVKMLDMDAARQTAGKINEYFDGAPILFIPIGCGGVLPGVNVFEQLQGDNIFYPLRMSKGQGDMAPVISSRDLTTLNELAKGSHVVVFDDIVQNAKTLKRFGTYLEGAIGSELYSCAIVDRRTREVGAVTKFTGYKPGLLDKLPDSLRPTVKELVHMLAHPMVVDFHPYARPF